jgi:hypothetical protein
MHGLPRALVPDDEAINLAGRQLSALPALLLIRIKD